MGCALDLSERISGHSFTVGWLLDSLRTHDDVFRLAHGDKEIAEVSAGAISGAKGFVSEVVRCTVSFVGSPEQYHTVLKIPGTAVLDEMHSLDKERMPFYNDEYKHAMTRLHQFECSFYNDLAPLLDVPVPRVFQTLEWRLKEQEGVIHMEDISMRGKTLGFTEPATLAQVKNVVQHLAHMHKNVLTTDRSQWEGKYLGNNSTMGDFLPMLGTHLSVFQRWCKGDNRIENLIKKYRKIMITKDYFTFITDNTCKLVGIRPVIVHGDLWGGNMMFATNAFGDATDSVVAIIDWQMMHEGSPMSDLARFLTMCADGPLRRLAETFVFDFYIECLQREFGADQKVPYTAEQMRSTYQHVFVNQAFLCVLASAFMAYDLPSQFPEGLLAEGLMDSAVLRGLHALEDVERLFEGDLRDLYERFGR